MPSQTPSKDADIAKKYREREEEYSHCVQLTLYIHQRLSHRGATVQISVCRVFITEYQSFWKRFIRISAILRI